MEIVEATKEDTKPLGMILAKVFEDHPFYKYVTEDPAKRKRMAAWMNQRMVAYGLAYGTVFTDEQKIGVSVIMPTANGALTIPRMIRLGLVMAPFYFGIGGFRKFMKFSSQTEKVRKGLMKDDHYLQLTVGVNPDVQGGGVGTALLKAGVELAESKGLDAYAETVLDGVVSWYDKNDYKVIAETSVPNVGTLYSMVRKAGS